VLRQAQLLAARSALRPRARLRETVGEPVADEILREARRLRPSVIVMGTHERGRNAVRVLRNSRVPVLIVRSRS